MADAIWASSLTDLFLSTGNFPAPGNETLALTRSPETSAFVLAIAPRVGVLMVAAALPAYAKSKSAPAPLPRMGAMPVKSTTASPPAPICKLVLAPPSAVTCAAFKLNTVLFQLPTRQASSPVSGAPEGAAAADALAGAGVAAVL